MEGEAAVGPGESPGAETARPGTRPCSAEGPALAWASAGMGQAQQCPRDSEHTWEPSPAWLPWPAPASGPGPGLPARGGHRARTAASILLLTLLPTGDPQAATGGSAGHLDDRHAHPWVFPQRHSTCCGPCGQRPPRACATFAKGHSGCWWGLGNAFPGKEKGWALAWVSSKAGPSLATRATRTQCADVHRDPASVEAPGAL